MTAGRDGGWVALLLTLAGCGGLPWFLGAPLDGHPSIPPRSRVVTVAEHRRNVEAASAAENRVVELAELQALAARDSLRAAESRRLVELLLARAGDWIALGRPVALVKDLRQIIALAPGRRAGLARALRVAERGAGDQWLAMGERARAEEEYRHAERDGATAMDFRFRAAWDAAVGDLETAALEQALVELPARTLAPFSEAYLNAGGGDPGRLYRAWRAARIYGPVSLRQRIESLPVSAAFPGAWRRESRRRMARQLELEEATPVPGSPLVASMPTPAQLFAGPTLARRLIPAARQFPELLAPSERSRAWVQRLVDEDPTSPDSFELAALIEARAGRTDSAAQKLEELEFYAPDRADAAARVARVWERTGEGRRACAAWEQAARLGEPDDARWCRFLDCAAQHAGATDLPTAAQFVAERAPDLVCGGGTSDEDADRAPSSRTSTSNRKSDPGSAIGIGNAAEARRGRIPEGM